MIKPFLETTRLLLRQWRPEDRPIFASMNADPRVMEFFSKPLNREESDALAARFQDHVDRRGFGLWAVELPGVAEFIGFVGLLTPSIETHFTPCVEVGWRLAYDYWGNGYASEAARASLDFGFHQLGLREIVSYTVPNNRRSRAVMERIGMIHAPDENFEHPSLPEGHPLRWHVLYRVRANDFQAD